MKKLEQIIKDINQAKLESKKPKEDNVETKEVSSKDGIIEIKEKVYITEQGKRILND